ncbi:MAG: MurT ligase domain-containing protein [Actinomycetia bacterium]|nr:MurT ligase domain-containing protein [Actinomycetes bacterium]
MKLLALIIGKLLVWLGGLLQKGSSTPGSIALRICPQLPQRLSLPPLRVAVTGSSGKGSTSALIAGALRELGLAVVHNAAGANMQAGVLSTLLAAADLRGQVRGDALVLEVDERSCKYIFPWLKPGYLVITNVTRDQPPRQRHTDFVFSEIQRALSGQEQLILNGDDPLLARFGLSADLLGEAVARPTEPLITTYGLTADCNFQSPTARFAAVDAAYCPICSARLSYGYHLIESLGDYRCPAGHFQRRLDVAAVALERGSDPAGGQDVLVLADGQRIQTNTRLLFNIYNVLAAYTLLQALPPVLLTARRAANSRGLINPERAAWALSQQSLSHKLFSYELWQGRPTYILNTKAENATTFNQALLFSTALTAPLVLVVGWMEISRRYQADDLSWLYDVAFELVADKLTAAICTGVDASNIAVRLKYAGLAEQRIQVIDDMDTRVTSALAATEGSILAILNFDHVPPFHKLLQRAEP